MYHKTLHEHSRMSHRLLLLSWSFSVLLFSLLTVENMKSYTKNMGLYVKFQSQFISIGGFYDLLPCQDLPGGPKASQTETHCSMSQNCLSCHSLSSSTHQAAEVRTRKWERETAKILSGFILVFMFCWPEPLLHVHSGSKKQNKKLALHANHSIQ